MSDYDRRSVLKSMGATGSTAVVGSGVASADSMPNRSPALQERIQSFESVQALQNVVDTHATETLSLLSEQGWIEEASLDAFDVQSHLDRQDTLAREEQDGGPGISISATGSERDQYTNIKIRTETKEALTELTIKPEESESYATVNPVNGKKRLLKPSHPDKVMYKSAECPDYTFCPGETVNAKCRCGPNGRNAYYGTAKMEGYKRSDGYCYWEDDGINCDNKCHHCSVTNCNGCTGCTNGDCGGW